MLTELGYVLNSKRKCSFENAFTKREKEQLEINDLVEGLFDTTNQNDSGLPGLPVLFLHVILILANNDFPASCNVTTVDSVINGHAN